MFDKDCFQYYTLSKCSSKIQSEMLSSNYALTYHYKKEEKEKKKAK